MLLKDYLEEYNPNYTASIGWQEQFGEDVFNFGYIASYKEAADILVENKVPDLYIFPIMFCYRQYLELLLKNICAANMEKENYCKLIKDVSHSLNKVWEYAKQILLCQGKEEKIIADIEMVVSYFDELDGNSFSFRYLNDKKQDRNIKNPVRINTLVLKNVMDWIDEKLRDTYDTV